MNLSVRKWGTLVILSLIWGSSYILIKKGLTGLTPVQLGSLRVIITTLLIAPIGYQKIKHIPREKMKWVALSAFVGSFLPAYLFAFAETEIDSSIASVLNSLVPLNTVIIGAIVFKIASSKKQIIGVFVGFIGTYLLIDRGMHLNPDQNYFYAGLVILCSFLYGFNVNIIKKYLNDVPAVTIAAGHFSVIFIPAIIIFSLSDFKSDQIYDNPLKEQEYSLIQTRQAIETKGLAAVNDLIVPKSQLEAVVKEFKQTGSFKIPVSVAYISEKTQDRVDRALNMIEGYENFDKRAAIKRLDDLGVN